MSNINEAAISRLFQDPDASSAVLLAAKQVAAPMVVGKPITRQERARGGIRILFWLFDESGSMKERAEDLRQGFSTEFIQALTEASQDDVSTLRIGGYKFGSGDPTPVWVGTDPDDSSKKIYFHSLATLPPLTKAEYDPDPYNLTALHKAIIWGIAAASRYAAEVQQDTQIAPEVDVMILTDGGNNCDPLSPAEPRQMIVGRNPAKVRIGYFFFETLASGEVDPEQHARELGIDPEMVMAFRAGPNETEEDRKKRWRRFLQVASKVSGSRGTSAVVAATAVNDDEEMV